MGERLYDPRTAGVIRREAAPGRLLVFGISAVVAGALLGVLHHELPFLAHWTGACSPDDYAYECEARGFYDVVVGVLGFVLFAAFGWLGHRLGPIHPTITCKGCGTRCFALDLEATGGRCPRCGADRFAYQIWLAGGGALGPRVHRFREDDVAGADVVQRFRETRTSSLHRLY